MCLTSILRRHTASRAGQGRFVGLAMTPASQIRFGLKRAPAVPGGLVRGYCGMDYAGFWITSMFVVGCSSRWLVLRLRFPGKRLRDRFLSLGARGMEK